MESSMPQAETVAKKSNKVKSIEVPVIGIPMIDNSETDAKSPEVFNTVVEIPVMLNQQGSGYEFQQAQSGNVMISDKVHLNLHLGEKGSLAFLSIRNALRFQNAKFSDGKPVFSNADTIRWLVDQVAEQV